MSDMNNSFLFLNYYSEIIEKEIQETIKQIDVRRRSDAAGMPKRKLSDLFREKPISHKRIKVKDIQEGCSNNSKCA